METIKDVNTDQPKKNKEKKFKRSRSFFHLLRLVWANRQYRAAIKLFLYFLFMVIVLLVVQFGTSQNNDIVFKTTLEKFGDLTSYQYTSTINENNNLIVINGQKTKEEHKFMINNINYIVKDNKIYISGSSEEVISPITNMNIFNLTPAILEKMINKSEELSTTDYTTGIREVNYKLDIKEFSKLYENKKIEIPGNIGISKQEEKSEIIKITLDLTDYFKFNNPQVTSYKIEIDYIKEQE